MMNIKDWKCLPDPETEKDYDLEAMLLFSDLRDVLEELLSIEKQKGQQKTKCFYFNFIELKIYSGLTSFFFKDPIWALYYGHSRQDIRPNSF